MIALIAVIVFVSTMLLSGAALYQLLLRKTVLMERLERLFPEHKLRKKPLVESGTWAYKLSKIGERVKLPELRCVEILPRHLALVDLESRDCRYPYGGDEEGDAITFCGHARREGSSYCAPHFHLTRNPEFRPDRAAGSVRLRLVDAA